jgi:hypothetical protein
VDYSADRLRCRRYGHDGFLFDGTRLVIGGITFPDTSQQDVDDLDTILNSIQIDPVFEAEQSGDDDPVETSVASSTSSA